MLVDGDSKVGHEPGVARRDSVCALARRDAPARNGLEVIDRAGDDAALVGIGHDGLGKRMLAAFFQRCCEFDQPLFGYGGGAVRTARGDDANDDGRALRDGAGLVENDGVDGLQGFERFGRFEQDAHLGAFTGAHHDGDGRGKAQRAWTADDDDGDGRGERLVGVAGYDEPGDERDEGDDEYGGNENAGDAVGDAGDGRLGGVGVLDEFDDLRESGAVAHARCTEGERSVLVGDGCGVYRIVGPFLPAGSARP